MSCIPFLTHRVWKNWHCNPNMSLILLPEEFFHKGISSVSLEQNIILSENMRSNKVAPILVCWFKSVSGYADSVSAACTHHHHSLHTCFGRGPQIAFGCCACFLVNICLHAELDCIVCKIGEKEKRGQRSEGEAFLCSSWTWHLI